jgi:predicted nucleic acid-binding protein
MTSLLDTNVLIRHFTGNPPEMARRATAFLHAAGARELVLVDLVFAEVIFVLQRVYKQPRTDVANMARAVLGLRAVHCSDASVLHRSVELFEHGLDFTDAYLVAVAEADGVPESVSFDRGNPNSPTVQRIEP